MNTCESCLRKWRRKKRLRAAPRRYAMRSIVITLSARQEAYVRRIVANMTNDELSALETSYNITYAIRIKVKITELKKDYMRERFYDLINRDYIFCDDAYTFPMIITPSESTDKVPKSLYEAEWNKMNGFEKRTLDVTAGCDGVLWWHRIIEKRAFVSMPLSIITPILS